MRDIGGPIRIVVVCEAAGDFRVATGLSDRITVETVEWVNPDTIDSFREWAAANADTHFLRWGSIGKKARRLRLRAHGRFGGEPRAQDAGAARKALLVIKETVDCQAAILLRDSDGFPERRVGLEQARDIGWSFAVIVGVAHTKRECWLLAGFSPKSKREEQTLARLKQELHFDPCVKSHKLTASAKAVVKGLGGGSELEERFALAATALLEKRGEKNGLCKFLRELRSNLVPLFRRPNHRGESRQSE